MVTGSCSWAHGCLKCWRDPLRALTIKPYKIVHIPNQLQIQASKKYSSNNTEKYNISWLVGPGINYIIRSFQPLSPPARSSSVLPQQEPLSAENIAHKTSFIANSSFSFSSYKHQKLLPHLLWYFQSNKLSNTSASLQVIKG